MSTAPRAAPSVALPGPRSGSAGVARCVGALLVVAALAVAPRAQEEDDPARQKATEQRLRAAFLLQFAVYARWPEQALGGEGGNLRIGVLGKDALGAAAKALEGRQVQGRAVDVLELGAWTGERTQLAALRGCHVLYVDALSAATWRALLKELTGLPMLVVSHRAGALAHGASIELFVQERKLRFAVDQDRLRAHRLGMSSKVLRLARPLPRRTPEIVEPRKQEPGQGDPPKKQPAPPEPPRDAGRGGGR